MIMAVKNGKDYREISSYFDCISLKLDKVSATVDDGEDRYWTEGKPIKYSGDLFLWFEGKPLKVSKYANLVIDPLQAKEKKDKAIDGTRDFTEVIGSRLIDVKFMDQFICCFDFENGKRIVFSSFDLEEGNSVGFLEIREIIHQINIEELQVRQIGISKRKSHTDHAGHYSESSLALYTDEGCIIVFPIEKDETACNLDFALCSEKAAFEYTRLLPIGIPKEIRRYDRDGKISAIRFRCEEGYLYLGTTAYTYNKIEILLSDEDFNPNECPNFLGHSGKRMEFRLK